MTIKINPDKSLWAELASRPAIDVTRLFDVVRPIVDDVRERGDEALLEYEERFDRVKLASLRVTDDEMMEAQCQVSQQLKASIQLAARNIAAFHRAQKFDGVRVETAPGVVCEQKSVPITNVGLYVPGGSAPLFSTVLMLALPAKIAGCERIVLCTPPRQDGTVNPAILFAAQLCGVTEVYKLGGSQAIAAMACGTDTVPRVDKIFGPGNQFVMAAKQWVSLQGVAIDMPAGPSEVEVLADETAVPAYVAADLLSQAEHGPDSQAVLVCTSQQIADAVLAELEKQLAALPRNEVATRSLAGSRIIIMDNIDDMVAFTNLYAPEHLIIAMRNAREVANRITNAGSIFLGNYACESAGDYASGTNHTLPTLGYARAYSGLSLDSFCRKLTLQQLTAEGIRSIGPAVVAMAEAEMLEGHANAMRLRVNDALSNDALRYDDDALRYDNCEVASLQRPNIASLEPYSCARDEFDGGDASTVFLDANESPYAVGTAIDADVDTVLDVNRYPDPLQREVKAEIAAIKGVPAENIFLGNGSDEAIDLIFRIFCRPGVDNVVAIDPTYGMYGVCADINDVEYRKVSLREDYSLDVESLIAATDANTKAIFVCSPNNPTGNTFTTEIRQLVERISSAMIIIDEAYIDFCPEQSLRHLVLEKDNVIVLSTMSKAWASAGVRLGMAFASTSVIAMMNKVKYPYNVNVLTQQYALEMLRNHKDDISEWVNITLKERTRVAEALKQLPDVIAIYPSEANFLLVKIKNATAVYKRLAAENVIVRNRSRVHLCGDCLRITIGTPEENIVLIEKLRK